MAKSTVPPQPTIAELQAQIESLKFELELEKEVNRKLLRLPEDTPTANLAAAIPWSTEWMQKELDDCEIVKSAVTRVYKQNVFKLWIRQSGDIVVKSHYGEAAQKYPKKKYHRLSQVFSPEGFFMLLQLMEFAEREFHMNRKSIMDKLTDGEDFVIEKKMNDF